MKFLHFPQSISQRPFWTGEKLENNVASLNKKCYFLSVHSNQQSWEKGGVRVGRVKKLKKESSAINHKIRKSGSRKRMNGDTLAPI